MGYASVQAMMTWSHVLVGVKHDARVVCTIICVSVTLEGNAHAHAQNGDDSDCGGMYSDPLLFRPFAYLTSCICAMCIM